MKTCEIFIGLVTGHPLAWFEFTGYAAAKRPEWVRGKLTRFLITSPNEVWGIFMSYSDVKIGGSPVPVALLPFSSNVKVDEGVLLKVGSLKGGVKFRTWKERLDAILHS